MVSTKITFHIKADIGIPEHLYDKLAEEFLNRLRKSYVEMLLKDDNLSQTISQSEFLGGIEYYRPWGVLGKSCPVYYKNHKDGCNDS